MSVIRTFSPNLTRPCRGAALGWTASLWAAWIAIGCNRESPPQPKPREPVQGASSPSDTASVEIVAAKPRPLANDYSEGPILETLEEEQKRDVRKRLAALFGEFSQPKLTGDSEARVNERGTAAENFRRRCAPCHGAAGAGDGPRSDEFEPRPRDFRRGLFKFTSTHFAAKATRDDLLLTLRQGLPGTGMPSFVETPPEELAQLVEHVILLAMRGEVESILANEADGADEPLSDDVASGAVKEVAARWSEAPKQVIDPPPAPSADEGAVERGRKLFQSDAYRCYVCHAIDGRGMPEYDIHPFEDSWGRRTKAFDLAAANLRRGASDVELYRRIANGVPGSGMPAYDGLIANRPDEAWDLVRYVQQIAAEPR